MSATQAKMASPTIFCDIKHPVVVATAVLEVSDGYMLATGIASCSPCDTWDPAIGKTLASARAIAALAQEMEASGLRKAERAHRKPKPKVQAPEFPKVSVERTSPFEGFFRAFSGTKR